MSKISGTTRLLALCLPACCAIAQVTTATFYGTVSDTTGAVVPSAPVTLIHEETGAALTRNTSQSGEVAFDFLRVGSYTVRVEATGFKRFESKGMELSSGQTVRQTLTLEVGALSETVTVEGLAALVSTASSEQLQTFEGFKVTELPLGRRNVSSVLRLATGVDIGSNRNLRINGVGSSGTGISVDGTDANSYPEQRGMAQYGARNYIDVMSIDAVQEVQLVRGILPAEYGGVLGGQVNVIAKSGSNQWHGSLFENYQSHALNARNPFVAARTASGATIPRPRIVFNQFGASAGGRIIRDRLFIFGAYEGYRESASRRVNGTVPTASYRSEILRALPFAETRLMLDLLPAANVPINDDIAGFEGIRNATSKENHTIIKGDYRVTDSSNLAVNYTRMRPFGLDPNYMPANDRTYEYVQDRLSASFTLARATWTSETRFGYNFSDMARLDGYFTLRDPGNKPEIAPWDRSLPRISVAGPSGFGLGSAEIWDMDGTTYSLDQKIARHTGKHSFKFGGRYMFYGGFRSNPENPSFSFQNKADFLANIPSQVTPTFGSPLYTSRMYEFGIFAQDDWRVTPKLVLNLGLRWDFYSNATAKAAGDVPVGFYNLTPPSDWQKLDFGAYRDPNNPYAHDPWVNLGPRFGFAYNPDAKGKTVFRGGFGALFSPQMPGAMRQAVAHPVVPFRTRWSLGEARELGLQFPRYTDELRALVEQQNARTGVRFPFSVFNPGLQNPYSMHYQFNIQHSLSSTMMFETGFVGVRGVKFLLHRRVNLPDRLTGIRPNPNVLFGGPYYVDHSQNTVYNGWQSSFRKRLSGNFALDLHYTWGKGLGVTGGDIGAYYGSDPAINLQDFHNLGIDRGPNSGDAKHRFLADWVYNLPRLANLHPLTRTVLGGWEVAGILSSRSGEPFTITQPCASEYHCRPDHSANRVAPVFDNWENNSTSRCVVGGRCSLLYTNRAAFAAVPVDPTTRIAVRPGNVANGFLRNPGTWTVDVALSKNFRIRESMNLQIRADMFNSLNHVNYNGPTADLNSATFGEINGAGGMRVVQLNARFTW
ncbi:MAG: TonB-dependent receptor [Bryobacteraceae bacterium]|nr:TonB-dependent receptor [Bryobacteraceae bacterium]